MQITMWSFFILLIGLLSKETTQVSAIRKWTSSAILSSSKPGCPERCGNLTIPYPFGIGKGCYFDEQFEVSCNNNSTALISHNNSFHVQHISMDSFMIVNSFSPFLYNKSSGKNVYGDENYHYINGKGHFSISNKNNIVAIGCDIYAYVKDLDTSSGDNIVIGCASFCRNSTNNVSSSSASSSYCTGSNGCCQSGIYWGRPMHEAFSHLPKFLERTVYTKMQITMWSFFILMGLLSKETTEVSAIRIWSSSAILASSKPGCPERCGNLTIPYPFGIGKGCYFDEQFEVSCNNNTAFSRGPGRSLKHISMDSITVANNFFPSPYNKSSGKNIDGDIYGEGENILGYFSISNKNNIVAIGCDIYAYVKDTSTEENIVNGCAAFCKNSTNNVSSSSASSSHCTGNNGCCQSAFPKIPREFSASIQTMNTEKASWASSNCTYFLIVEKGISEFDFTQLLGKCKEDDFYEGWLALDWVIGNVSCDKAMRRPKYYACGKNSKCVDNTTRPAEGYRCNCSPGYQGNPYLPHGCQDINECASPKGNRCPDYTYCVNTPGSFFCAPNKVKNTSAKQLFLGIVAAITFAILVAVCLWLGKWLRKREENKAKQKFFKRNGGLLLQERISLNGESSGGSLLKLFLKEELEKATDNFNEIRILGKGGLGTVYKGMLSDGSIVAVKKSNAVDEDQIEQFINEILILSQINHRHIVKVLGCCLETQVPLLVYEYISSGTLSSHIQGNLSHNSNPTVSKSELDDQIVPLVPHPAIILSWDHRLRIAAEIAGALSYMHSCASTPILHRDIKSSNILLDDNFRAVVSDFGLSRLLSVDKTHLTTRVGGTLGYIDPEYFRSGQLTDKCDVYAFGVILAELLTSQRVVTSNKPEDPGLVIRFTSLLKENRIIEIVDPEIVKEVEDEHMILAVAKLAKRCLNFNARKRPSMKEVAAELDQPGKMRPDMPHAERFQSNISPKSESSCSHTSDCTEEDNQNSVSRNEMHYDRK